MTISNETTRVETTTIAGEFDYGYDIEVFDPEADLKVVLYDPASPPAVDLVWGTDYTATSSVVTLTFDPDSGKTLSIILDPPLLQDNSFQTSGGFSSAAVEESLDKLVNIVKRTRDLVTRTLGLDDGGTLWDALGARIINVADPEDAQDAATKVYVDAEIASATLDPTTPVTPAAAELLDDATHDDMLDTLGAGASGKAWFKLPTLASMLSYLGISSYGSLLVAEADAEAARDRLEINEAIPQTNIIENADHKIWQDGPTLAAVDDNTHASDRWVTVSDGDGVVDIARASAGSNPALRNTMLVTANDATSQFGFFQMIDAATTTALRGTRVSLSVQLQTYLTLLDFRLVLLRWAGTADDRSASSDPINSWEGTTERPLFNGDWNFIDDVTFSASGSWGTYVLEDVGIPVSGVNNLAFFLCTNDASFPIGSSFAWGGANLVSGTYATPFVTQPKAVDEAVAASRFSKTYEPDVAEGASDLTGAIGAYGKETTGQDKVNMTWTHPVMVENPTYRLYNPNNGVLGQMANSANTVVVSAGQAASGSRSVSISGSDDAVNDTLMLVHAVADARL